jgi:hypothetical protein
MSYADIAAVVALFFTAFTFAFSMWQWNRRRKSEQIIIARDLMDRMLTKRRRLNEYAAKRLIEEYRPSTHLEYLDEVLSDIHYFGYLIN